MFRNVLSLPTDKTVSRMDEIIRIETIDQYDQLFGLETLHPLVNVIDFSKATKQWNTIT